jgi:hypothetical protein
MVFDPQAIEPACLGPQEAHSGNGDKIVALNLFYFSEDLNCFLKIRDLLNYVLYFCFEMHVQSDEVFTLANELFILELVEGVEVERP